MDIAKGIANQILGKGLEEIRKDVKSMSTEYASMVDMIRMCGAGVSAYGVMLLLSGEEEKATSINKAGELLVEAIKLLEAAVAEPAPETAEDSPEEEGANVTE